MYNFNFINGENLIEIIDDVWVKKDENEKVTTIALTDMRILFLDYINNNSLEVLRISRGVHTIRNKEVYYQINLDDIDKIYKSDYYTIALKNGFSFQFNNERLYKLLLDYRGEV